MCWAYEDDIFCGTFIAIHIEKFWGGDLLFKFDCILVSSYMELANVEWLEHLEE